MKGPTTMVGIKSGESRGQSEAGVKVEGRDIRIEKSIGNLEDRDDKFESSFRNEHSSPSP